VVYNVWYQLGMLDECAPEIVCIVGYVGWEGIARVAAQVPYFFDASPAVVSFTKSKRFGPSRSGALHPAVGFQTV
jgi:hypothetical protein